MRKVLGEKKLTQRIKSLYTCYAFCLELSSSNISCLLLPLPSGDFWSNVIWSEQLSLKPISKIAFYLVSNSALSSCTWHILCVFVISCVLPLEYKLHESRDLCPFWPLLPLLLLKECLAHELHVAGSMTSLFTFHPLPSIRPGIWQICNKHLFNWCYNALLIT